MLRRNRPARAADTMTTLNIATVYGTSLGRRESVFLQEIRQVATLLGWRVYHTHDSRRSDVGFPDLVLAKPGRLIFAELKTERGRIGAEQAEWLEVLGTAAESYLWRPADRDDIIAILKGERK